MESNFISSLTSRVRFFAEKLTTGNVRQTKPVRELATGLIGKLYVDKGYISKGLKAYLLDNDIKLVTNERKCRFRSKCATCASLKAPL